MRQINVQLERNKQQKSYEISTAMLNEMMMKFSNGVKKNVMNNNKMRHNNNITETMRFALVLFNPIHTLCKIHVFMIILCSLTQLLMFREHTHSNN